MDGVLLGVTPSKSEEIKRFWIARGCVERAKSVLDWMDEKKKLGREVRLIMPFERREIPHSELAISTRAAGQGIVVSGCTVEMGEPYYCKMVYEKEGECGLIEGLASELLPHELR